MNLNQVTVPSLDLSKAVPFYQTLGLKLIVHSERGHIRRTASRSEMGMARGEIERSWWQSNNLVLRWG